MNPTTINAGTKEYKNLVAVARMLEAVSEKDRKYIVKDTYFDYGQNWMWTTIIREDREWGGIQILSPRQWESIIFVNNAKELAEAVEDIRSGQYFHE